MPVLSICVPVYNEQENLPLLHDAIAKVCDPAGIDFELLLVDDGSKDNSWAEIEKLVAKDPRVRGIKFAYNCGETEASDAGLRHARGQFVMTMDADLQDQVTDAGCTYRCMRRECVDKLKLYRGLHRFIPTLLKMEGYTVVEVPVTNNPRIHGESKYGVWNRLFKSFRDMLAIRWMKQRLLNYKVATELTRS